MKHLSSQSDSILKNRCLSRIGKGEGELRHIDEVKRLVARIYEKEIEFQLEFDKAKKSLASLGRVGFDDSISQLADQSLGYFTFRR